MVYVKATMPARIFNQQMRRLLNHNLDYQHRMPNKNSLQTEPHLLVELEHNLRASLREPWKPKVTDLKADIGYDPEPLEVPPSSYGITRINEPFPFSEGYAAPASAADCDKQMREWTHKCAMKPNAKGTSAYMAKPITADVDKEYPAGKKDKNGNPLAGSAIRSILENGIPVSKQLK